MKTLLVFILITLICLSGQAQQWQQIGPQAPFSSNNGNIYRITTDINGNVYAAGNFTDANNKRYVAKWNGTGWSSLGSGVNALNANGYIGALASDSLGNIYAGGMFTDGIQAYVAKWDGSHWTKMGTTFSTASGGGEVFDIIFDRTGNLYVAGSFPDSLNIVHVYKWGGTDWTTLGTGSIMGLGPGTTIYTLATDSQNNVYAAGEVSIGTYPNAFKFVAKWDGSSWSELGSGLNANNPIRSLAVDAIGNVYAAGDFSDSTSRCYVAKWDGNTWSQVGTGPNALNYGGINSHYSISQIKVDPDGNIYVACRQNNAGKYYIAKWNGTNWSEIGHLNANEQINTVAIGASGIYCGGAFTDSIGKKGVSGYLYAMDSMAVYTENNVSPSISISHGTLQMRARVFPSIINQSVIWSITPGTGSASISPSGLITAQSNGTVWAKAIAVQDLTMMDSLAVTITNQPANGIWDALENGILSLYPNPSKGTFYIHMACSHPSVNVSVTDMSGRELLQKQVPDNAMLQPFKIDISNLQSGIYLIYFSGNHMNAIRKIAIERQ